jgi:hypothetical protein
VVGRQVGSLNGKLFFFPLFSSWYVYIAEKEKEDTLWQTYQTSFFLGGGGGVNL